MINPPPGGWVIIEYFSRKHRLQALSPGWYDLALHFKEKVTSGFKPLSFCFQTFLLSVDSLLYVTFLKDFLWLLNLRINLVLVSPKYLPTCTLFMFIFASYTISLISHPPCKGQGSSVHLQALIVSALGCNSCLLRPAVEHLTITYFHCVPIEQLV